jgi:hypothetical protein
MFDIKSEPNNRFAKKTARPARSAQEQWMRLKGRERITYLLEGKRFIDGEMQDAA